MHTILGANGVIARELSTARGAALRDALVERGVEPERLSVTAVDSDRTRVDVDGAPTTPSKDHVELVIHKSGRGHSL